MNKTSVFSFFTLSFLFFFIVIALFLIPLYSNAETKYVSGAIVVNIRDTTEKHYNVLASVETGEQVDVLEEKGHLSKVRTKDNVEGWLPSQYLKNDKPSIETITKLKNEIADLKKKNNQLEKEKTLSETIPPSTLGGNQKQNYRQTIESLRSDNARLVAANQGLTQRLQEKETAIKSNNTDGKDISALKGKIAVLKNKLNVLRKNSQHVVDIVKERDVLKNEIVNLQSNLVKSQEINKKLEKEKFLHWFFAGAAVFFIGFLSSKLFVRKKSKLSF